MPLIDLLIHPVVDLWGLLLPCPQTPLPLIDLLIHPVVDLWGLLLPCPQTPLPLIEILIHSVVFLSFCQQLPQFEKQWSSLAANVDLQM